MKDDIYKIEIDTIKKHLSGEKKMNATELEELGMLLEVDIPYTDDWRSHGYKTYEEWHDKHVDFLEKLDEVLKLYNSIPEVVEIRKNRCIN